MNRAARRSLRCIVPLLLGLAVFPLAVLGAAEPPETGFSGATATRIAEPVFGGEAVVYEAGRGKPRSVVLVHGVGDNGARDFVREVEWLARDHHVVAFDLPGFGRSSRANAPYTPENYVAFIRHVVDRHVGRPFVLIGHSMGGLISLRYGATHPQDIERLVVASVPGVLHRLSFTSQYVAQRSAEWIPDFLRPVERVEAWARKFFGRMERTNSVDPAAVLADAARREAMFEGEPARIAGFALTHEDVTRWLARVAAPTLVVWGDRDDVAPLRTGGLLVQKLAAARLAVLKGSAHTPMEDVPEALRAAIEPFVRTGEWPASAAPAPALPAAGTRQASARCEREHRVVYEGDYDSLVVNRCRSVLIRNARVRELRVLYSTVEINNSVVGEGGSGLHARSSTITVNGGRFEADVPITALGSRLDFAGTEIVGRRAIAHGPVGSSLVFSLSTFESPAGRRLAHAFFAVTPEQPLP
jgi:pimeloyl-ACP methyl ester carboxylesterase